MTKQDALRFLEKCLEMEPNTLTGGEILRNLENWDSLSTLAFIAKVDKELGLALPGNQVARCRTVDELLDLLVIAPNKKAA
jgi:acyl carrier protein